MIEARRKARIEIARLHLEDMRAFAAIRKQDSGSPECRTVKGLHNGLRLLVKKDPLGHKRLVRHVHSRRLRRCEEPIQAALEQSLSWVVDQLAFPLVAPRRIIDRLEWAIYDAEDENLDPSTIDLGDLILDEARLAEEAMAGDSDLDEDGEADGRRAVALSPEMSGASSRFAGLAIDPGVAVFAENGPSEGIGFGSRPYQRWRTRERRRKARVVLSHEAVVELLEKESGRGIEELRALKRKGRPSKAAREVRADLVGAVYRLRAADWVGAEALGDALGCDRITVWRLAKKGAELNATSPGPIGEESSSVIAA